MARQGAKGSRGQRLRIGIVHRQRDPALRFRGAPRWLGGYARDLRLLELACGFDALLDPDDLRAWVSATPPDFLFDVQAFRALARHAVDLEAVPADLHHTLIRGRQRVRLRDMTGIGQYLLWERFRNSLDPLRSAGKLGCVVFRFPQSFQPELYTGAFMAQLRDRLPDDRVAVELPDSWFAGRQRTAHTLALLRDLGLGYAGAPRPAAAHALARRRAGRPDAAVLRLRADQEHAAEAQLSSLLGSAMEVHLVISGSRATAAAVARQVRSAHREPPPPS